MCVVYAVDDEDTLDSVTDHWLPLLRSNNKQIQFLGLKKMIPWLLTSWFKTDPAIFRGLQQIGPDPTQSTYEVWFFSLFKVNNDNIILNNFKLHLLFWYRVTLGENHKKPVILVGNKVSDVNPEKF